MIHQFGVYYDIRGDGYFLVKQDGNISMWKPIQHDIGRVLMDFARSDEQFTLLETAQHNLAIGDHNDD